MQEKIVNVNVPKSDFVALKKLADAADRSIRSYLREMIKKVVAEAKNA